MRVTATIAVLLCSHPVAAAAQEMSLMVGAGQVTDNRGESRAGLTIAPSVLWAGPSAALLARAEAVLPSEGGKYGGISLSAKALNRPSGAGFALRGDLSGSGSIDGGWGVGATITPSVAYRQRAWRLEAGPRLGVTRYERSDGRLGDRRWPLIGGGAEQPTSWRTITGAAVEASAITRGIEWLGAWSFTRATEVQWQDAFGAVGFTSGRMSISVSGGLRSGVVQERWAQAGTTYAVSAGVDLLARAGRYPADPLSGRRGGTTAEIALSIRSGRNAKQASASRR